MRPSSVSSGLVRSPSSSSSSASDSSSLLVFALVAVEVVHVDRLSFEPLLAALDVEAATEDARAHNVVGVERVPPVQLRLVISAPVPSRNTCGSERIYGKRLLW